MTTPVDPTERLLRHFDSAHLPMPLRNVSRPFGELAYRLVAVLPAGPDRTHALRQLLSAKDSAVRALIEYE